MSSQRARSGEGAGGGASHGYRVLDADRHVIEPIAMWREYLPAELRGRAPGLVDPWGGEPPAARAARLGDRALLPLPPMPALGGRPLYRKMPERAWAELA